MMKKLSMLLTIALLISSFCMTGASAAGAVTVSNGFFSYSIGSNDLAVTFNGEAVTFPDAKPFVDKNGRTLIPVRFVAETMGANVTWDKASRTAIVEQNGITVKVPVGSDKITVTKDGKTTTVQMNTEAIIKDTRTFVPIRFVAEALGAWVGYSDLYMTVQIYNDVLTPVEIDRLHGYYDMTWEEQCNSVNEKYNAYSDEQWLTSNPQIAYFSGTYGFENANEYKLNCPNGIEAVRYTKKTLETYTGKTTNKTFTFGTQPNVDFAKLILSEANQVEDYYSLTSNIKATLKTDLSCVYFSRHTNDTGACVRGVMTITIPNNADISWIESNCKFISNPKVGETRDIDVEIWVMTFGGLVAWREMDGITALK